MKLCDDVRYWEEHKTYQMEEAAIRFHHRLVAIHPFPNGNGRVSRLAADLFLEYRKFRSFTWGSVESLVDDSGSRKEYLLALREADKGKYERLLHFALGK